MSRSGAMFVRSSSFELLNLTFLGKHAEEVVWSQERLFGVRSQPAKTVEKVRREEPLPDPG
jgi:hypothetical protein